MAPLLSSGKQGLSSAKRVCVPFERQIKKSQKALFYLVPLTGIEPVRCFHRGILSPLRLPIPPQRRRMGLNLSHLTIAPRKSQAQGLDKSLSAAL